MPQNIKSKVFPVAKTTASQCSVCWMMDQAPAKHLSVCDIRKSDVKEQKIQTKKSG